MSPSTMQDSPLLGLLTMPMESMPMSVPPMTTSSPLPMSSPPPQTDTEDTLSFAADSSQAQSSSKHTLTPSHTVQASLSLDSIIVLSSSTTDGAPYTGDTVGTAPKSKKPKNSGISVSHEDSQMFIIDINIQDVQDEQLNRSNPTTDIKFFSLLSLIYLVKPKDACSSLQCKELFKMIQLCNNTPPVNHLLDMKVLWSSTYVMLQHAHSWQQSIDEFILVLGLKEANTDKQHKISTLTLSEEEWTWVHLFCNILQHADGIQQVFSMGSVPTLQHVLLVLKKLYILWEKASRKP
ncbi:hypothetical protein EI94DRAFT_1811296 [Lactarius quietus]|nr:hypothetical protein EI94DRAFT_1811296 [Lactarius quietus]